MNRYFKFGRSIFGRVVLIITILSVFLFVTFGIIFKSVYNQYLNDVLIQNGNNLGSLVESALYHAMIENDKSSLQYTLDNINNLTGIEDVSMYDSENDLVYSSYNSDSLAGINPNCNSCHDDFDKLFPGKEKSYKIISAKSECRMSRAVKGERHLLIRSPILNSRSCYENSCHAHSASDDILGSLVIRVPLKEMDTAMQRSSLEFYLMAIGATIFLALALIWFTRREIKRPLTQLIRASVAVSGGDLNKRVDTGADQLDDMRMVSEAFNNMMDNLQKATIELENWSQQLEYKVRKKSEELGAAQNELIHVERLASLGKLSSSVAHEINNPLAGILVYAKLVQKQLSNPEFTEEKKALALKHLSLIESETKRCGEIVKGLLEFSKKEETDFEPFHLHEILEDTYILMTHPVKIANILFRKEFLATRDLIYCSPNQIKQACVAMIVNAAEAISENGEILLRTSNPTDTTVRLEIIDNGIGISPEDIPHIFEPFFSTKHEAKGIGLGLPIVHGIMQSHNANIQVTSQPGEGTSFSVTFTHINNQA